MPFVVALLAIAAGLIVGGTEGEGTATGWVIAGGAVGLFGLLGVSAYFGNRSALREAEHGSAEELAVIGETTFRAPGDSGSGWRLPMALVGLLGAAVGLAAGYSAYRAVRDGGQWIAPALVLPVVAYGSAAARSALVPARLRKRMEEIRQRRPEPPSDDF